MWRLEKRREEVVDEEATVGGVGEETPLLPKGKVRDETVR